MINLTDDLKRIDSRQLYMVTTFSFQWGFGRMPRSADEYFVTQYTDDGWIRGQTIFNDQAPNFSKDYSENIRNVHVPVISHEIGQYSVFPRMIDNFLKNRNMATVFETRSGNGKLLFSSIDLYTDLEVRPVARQLKYSLIEYMKSKAFSPETETDVASIKQLLVLDEE